MTMLQNTLIVLYINLETLNYGKLIGQLHSYRIKLLLIIMIHITLELEFIIMVSLLVQDLMLICI